MKGNSINDCDILKFVISFRGVQCNYSPRRQKKSPDTPLLCL